MVIFCMKFNLNFLLSFILPSHLNYNYLYIFKTNVYIEILISLSFTNLDDDNTKIQKKH
jgi:hypothetical protein